MKEPLTARADLADAPKSALPLKAAVGANAAPGADVLAVKNTLRQLGLYVPPKFPDGVRRLNAFPDREMTEGVKAFQKRFGLKQDGTVLPGGPTERLMVAALGLGPKDAAGNARKILGKRAVEPRRDLSPAGLDALIQALTMTGNASQTMSSLPGRQADAVRFAVEDFQKDFPTLLRRDGKAPSGGKTQKLLGRVLSLIETGDKHLLKKGKEKAAGVGPFKETVTAANGGLEERDNPGVLPDGRAQTPAGSTHPIKNNTAQSNGSAVAASGKVRGTRSQFDPYKQKPPTIKREIFIDNRWWQDFGDAVKRSGASDKVAHAYLQIFGIEGGLTPDHSENPVIPAVSGITKDYYDKYAIKFGLPPHKVPSQLTMDEKVIYYRKFLNQREFFHVTAPSKGGIERVLNRIDDPHVGAGLADTMFRHGGPAAARILQKAIRDVLATVGSPIPFPVDGVFGSQSMNHFVMLANTPTTKPILCDRIAVHRKLHRSDYEGDVARADYFKCK